MRLIKRLKAEGYPLGAGAYRSTALAELIRKQIDDELVPRVRRSKQPNLSIRLSAALTTLPEGWNKRRMYIEHDARLAATDASLAHAWVETLLTPTVRHQATLEMARGIAVADPQ